MKSCCEDSCGCGRPEANKPRRNTWLIAFCSIAVLIALLQLMLG